jgi:hypothetical protein
MTMLTYTNAFRTAELHSRGYAHIPAAELHMSDDTASSLPAFQQAFENLRSDGVNRKRAYLRLVMLPSDVELDLSYGSRAVLGSDYLQGLDHNPEAGGQVRQFAPLDVFTRANSLLRAIVAADARLCRMSSVWPASSNYPMQVGVHLIRLMATPDQPGVGVPDQPHKDSEPFTFIHLVNRHGVEGGDTEIFANGSDGPGELLFRAALQHPLDTAVVYDPAVWHYVRPVTVAPGYRIGWRDVLLVDFAPMVPVTVSVRGLAQPTVLQATWPLRLLNC